ncbi:PadR family transcriptional regulator [Novosphingobium sp.]|uniref:PadR family transcriptional regulator n=1 Tax=Novosphingobium sp. TaxID=1874826 RepID=UPI0025D14231|nr:PadR family transcriptional regulator [Novosphingobium sp.]
MHFHNNKRGRFAHEAIRGLFGHRHGHGPFGGGGFGGGFGPDGEGGRGGPGGFGGGPGGRRGKRFSGDELRLMVLALLAEGPQHGYQLIRAFTEKSGEAYAPSPGVLYPLLSLLADMGLAEEIAGNGARRSFALTDAGKAEIEAKKAEIDAAFARLAAMAEHASRTDAAPVRRAMMNLRTATVQRLTREGGDDELALKIAKLLDNAAQAIERL